MFRFLLWYGIFALTHLFVQISLSHREYLNQLSENSKKIYPSVGIVIPSYNEPVKDILNCVKSCLNQDYPKPIKVIVVDDGSKDKSAVYELKKIEDKRLKVISCKKNMGKRHAQKIAFDLIDKKVDIIVTIDSDTILKKDAIFYLVQKFNDKKVGAITGNVRGKIKNVLSRLIDIRYWTAFNQERGSQSLFGTVLCCCGVLSAYRSNLIRKVKDKYIKQKFLGIKCTFGDDRYLTNLILDEGYKVKYEINSEAITSVPLKINNWLRQQCLSENEQISVIKNNRFISCKIGELFKDAPYKWSVPKDNILSISFNDELKIEKKEVIGVLRILNEDKRAIKITLDNGQNFIVSKEHLMLIANKNGFERIPAKSLSNNMYIPSISKLDIEENIVLSDDFGKLVGFYLSEGCIDYQSLRLSFNYNCERDLAEESVRIIKQEFPNSNPKIVKQTSCWIVRVYSRDLVKKFNELGFSGNATTKIVPSIVFEQSESFIKNVIESYFIGDGHVRIKKTKRGKGYEAIVSSASKDLIYGVQLLLKRCGIDSSMRESKEKNLKNKKGFFNRFFLSIRGKDNLRNFYEFTPKLWKRKNIIVTKSKQKLANIPSSIIDYNQWNPIIKKISIVLSSMALTLLFFITLQRQEYMKKYRKTIAYKESKKKSDKKYYLKNKNKIIDYANDYSKCDYVIERRRKKLVINKADLGRIEYLSEAIIRRHSSQDFVLKIANSNIQLRKVSKIEEVDYFGDFYDVEIKDNHNFMHSYGIFSSNCRWNKSFYRELLYSIKIVLKNPLKLHPYVIYDLVMQAFLPLCLIFALILMAYKSITISILFFFGYLAVMTGVALIRGIYALFRTGEFKFLLFPFYALLHVFLLIPVRIVALCTLRNTKWGTR